MVCLGDCCRLLWFACGEYFQFELLLVIWFTDVVDLRGWVVWTILLIVVLFISYGMRFV